MTTKTKEDAMKEFCKMIKESWTWERLTAKERSGVMDAIQFCHNTSLAGTYTQRYAQLYSVYNAYLTALDYQPINWRERNEEKHEDTFCIESLYASAWENAITNTAKLMEERGVKGLTLRDNWQLLESIANNLGDVFDVNGELVK